MVDTFDRFGNKQRAERMRLEKERERQREKDRVTTPARKNKPRDQPAGATISGHAPHDLDILTKLVASSGASKSKLVVECVAAGVPIVAERYKKAARQ